MPAKLGEVGVFGQPLEVTETQVQGAVQCGRSGLKPLGERVTASEIVVDQRIGGAEPAKLFVHFKPLLEASTAREIVAEGVEGFHISRIAPDDAFEESDFDVKIARLVAVQFFSAF